MFQGTFPEEITGTRLILKKLPVTFDMARQIFTLADADRDGLRFLPWIPYTHRPEDSYTFLYESDKNWRAKTDAEYGIWHKETNTFMGCIGAMDFHDNDEAMIGFWLGKDFRGHGYMCEAVALMENMLFPTVNRIIIRNDTANEASIHVAEKMGYHRDGIMRAGLKYADGHYADCNIFSKLRSDWS